MEKTKAKYFLKKIGVIILISIFFLSFSVTRVNASIKNKKSNSEDSEIQSYEININNKLEVSKTINDLMLTINSEGINKNLLEQVFDLYMKFSEKYTNSEIANIIENNVKELQENYLKKDKIKTLTKILKRFDTEKLRKVVSEIDVNDILEKIENGENIYSIIKDLTKNLTISEKTSILLNMFISEKTMKIGIYILLVIFIYRTLLRCIIYKKAHKKAWFALVPIYRNVTMLKICSMSPWWLLLLLIPVVGWMLLILVSVASKFMLAESFGKGSLFAFGLWLLAPIFETILVFSKETKYIGIEE